MNRIISLDNLSGGEASVYPLLGMPPKYGIRFQNCQVSDNGGVAKIPGYTRINSDAVAGPIKSGFEFSKNDGTTIELSAGAGQINKHTGTSVSTIKTGLDASAKVWFASFGDLCLSGNGVDTPLKYDGTTVSSLGGLPSSTMFKKPVVFKGRVWWVDATNKMQAFYSALQAPEDYTTINDAGYIDFAYVLSQGDELVEIRPYIDLLIFFFKKHILIYSGTNPTSVATGGDFRIIQSISDVGLIGPGAIADLGTDLLFLSASGVKSIKQVVTTGSMTIGDVSEMIFPEIQREIANDTSGEFAAAHYPRKGWFLLLINKTVWVYSYARKAWSRIVGADINGMYSLQSGKLRLCGSTYVYNYGGSWSFDGLPIPMIWEGAWLRFIKQGFKYYPNILEVMFNKGVSTAINGSARFDMNATQPENIFTMQPIPGVSFMDEAQADTWDNAFYMDTVQEWESIRTPLFGGGKAMQLIFSNISTAGPIEFNTILIQGKTGGRL